MREEPLALARRAEIRPVDTLDAGGAQCALGRGPEIEPSVADDVVAERLAERGRHLFPDLVAAGADAGTDRRSAAGRDESAQAGAYDPGEQAAPACVQDRKCGTLGVLARDG